MNLTPDSPFSARLNAYLAERFPLGSHVTMVVIYFLANQFLAQALEASDASLAVGWFTVFGMVYLFCTFFHLRVFDECKDYEEDCRHYPERLLSRGVVTLCQLKILAIVAIVLELAIGAAFGLATLVAVCVTVVFSWVMRHEFFVPRFLKSHFVIYAVAHMLIMPLLAAAVFSFTTGRAFWLAPALFWIYAIADFFSFANWEISRKIRTSETEIEGVESYSKIFGVKKSCAIVLCLRLVSTSLAVWVGIALHLSAFYYCGLAILFLATLFGIVHFLLAPSPRTAKNLEHYGGWYIIIFYLVLAVELVRLRGIGF